ncbi:hypothetical protein ACK336_16880 [Aeromonas veronii]
MKFLGVIGNRNSGKSSIIQSLSGCRTANYRDYMYGVPGQSIYVCCSSPQEKAFEFNNSQDLAAISAVMTQVVSRASSGCRGMVMAIQPNNPRSRPSMESIFHQAVSAGFTDLYAFVVDPGYASSFAIFPSVNQRLKNTGVSAHISQISGANFPFVNATTINSITSFVY